MKQQSNNINFEVKRPTFDNISLSTEIPSLMILSDRTPLNYNLSPKPSDECLLYGFRERNADLDINCTYSNARYSISTKPIVNKAYIKELSIGLYLVGLTEDGKFDIGLIDGNGVVYSGGAMVDVLKQNFKQFEQVVIRDFFIGEEFMDSVGSGVLSILTDNQLLIYRFTFAHIKIEFESTEKFDLKALSLDLTGLRNVFYLGADCFVILQNGFYKLTKKSEIWEPQFFDKFDIDGQVVELKDISATITMINGCISIKGYGVAFFNHSGGFKTLKVFKHEHVIGIVTSSHTINNFNVGILIDNQSDENVKEFFLELSFNAFESLAQEDIKLSRVLISSGKVKCSNGSSWLNYSIPD
jgi:hypothetical protein